LRRLRSLAAPKEIAIALHEIPLKAAGTMQGETRVPIAIGRARRLNLRRLVPKEIARALREIPLKAAGTM